MSDVFEEVEESLRSDKADVLWSKYRLYVYAIGLLVIAAVGGSEYMKWQADKTQAARIIVFENARDALLAGDYVEAEKGFAELVAEDSAISPMAANYLARVKLQGGGDQAGAEVALSGQARDDGEPFERLATLKVAYAKAETINLAELETLLANLVSGDDGYAVLAQELIAAKAYEAGDYVRARKEYSYLRFAPNAPQGVLVRAQIALAVIPAPPLVEDNADTPDIPEIVPENGTTIEEEAGQ